MKQAKIKGGVYAGRYWRDFYTKTAAKKIAHKWNRQQNKKIEED